MADATEAWSLIGGWALRMAILSLFFINLRRLLVAVEPKNRAMGPNLVWLNLIPVFDFVWAFITVFKVRDSFRNQYRTWGRISKDNAFPIGLVSVSGYVISQLGILLVYASPAAGMGVYYGVGLVAFVAWIAYWANTSSQKNALEHTSLEFSGARPMFAPAPAVGAGVAPAGVAPVGVTPAGVVPAGPPAQAGSITCSACGFVASPGEAYCRSCGASLVAPQVAAVTANCAYCGTPYRPGGKFCPSCGRPASQAES